ncbi:SusC/RagA family TonB-linked outer membrane protein [Flavobacterium noncentrifugens]|uniref:Iron complex outermembrane recepter protein n=1 Tax=Flavobacterium noncentrifugens TaxID=1128970 RepID=A0A1G9AV89_9FLAO|nr:TonB-dependent receptor [Flavobacterium noncentrifugens]GEP51596.1 SusC/RagA family TonB-linked outer membrane protein [Flavobacterium noncentrifugens]SDK31191.1 iron complex outermembrane recepter protein [Flavobacterium noncentrifugens]
MKTIYNKLLFLFLLLPFSVLAQSTLTGTVLDGTSKQPLPGVNVVVQGSATGTQTDFDGKFQLANVKKGDVVVFSYLGYTNSTITYSGQTNLSINLAEESNQLQEVVVQVGYGTVKKKDATGAVTAISSKDFNKGLNVTSESLISGRISGVNVTTGGAPGAKADIRIRGGSSLNASNDPLIVIDGLPMSNATPSGMTGILSTLNPDDIESFTVLKDASASAIYGSRAANGVIVITTKKGSKGLKVSFNSQTSISVVNKMVDVLSADEFRKFVTERGTTAQIAAMGTASTDWQKEIFRDAIATNNNISASGSLFDRVPVRLSVGNTATPGVLRNTNFERTTTSLALNPTFFDNHLKIDISGNIAFGKNQFQDEGAVIGSAIAFDPTQSVYDSSSRYGGYFEWLEANGDVALLPAKNPVARLNQNDRRATSTRKWGNIRLDYQLPFFEALRAVVEGGIDKINSSGFETNSTTSINGYQPIAFSAASASKPWEDLGDYSSYTDDRQNKNLNAYLNYVKDFGKFRVDVTGGYNYQLFQREGFSSGATIRPNPQSDVTTDPDINLQSYFGRVNLGYNSKYLLTVNYRRDGTSRFSEENRWGNFAGGALAWNISEESFLKGNKTISALKLRVGYGETGQQDISAQYDYLRRVTLGGPSSNYIFGPYSYRVARTEGYNQNIKWEELKETNVGVDYGFLNNRITGSINYFDKKSSDLLADIAYPDGANLRNSGFANIGSLETKGVEFSINSDVIKTENLNWNVAFNTTYIDQKITDLGITVPGFTGYETGDNISGGSGNKIKINTVDYAPSAFYVYEQVYDQNHRPIQGVYVDRNGDGVINVDDKYRYKKPAADYTFGLFSTLNYKQLDFTMSWRASLGNYVYDNVSSDHGYANAALTRQNDLANITTDYFNTGFTFQDNGTSSYLSDYYVKNASFIKLDNVTLGYTLNKSLLKSVSLRFSAGVQNVLTITKYDGIDPERFSGVDGSIYPRARTYIFGVNANF